jgi:hypothetical protein
MATILFVHGTGVRKGSYLSTLTIVQRALDDHDIFCELAPCLWGDDLGAKSPSRSVPARSPVINDPLALTGDQEYARWELLYRDPLFELRLLKNKPNSGEVRTPTALNSGVEFWSRIIQYRPSPRVTELLVASGLFDDWGAARSRILVADPTARAVIEDASDEIGEPVQATARAVLAQIIQNAALDDRPVPTAERRDLMVQALIEDWGANVYGLGTFLLQFAVDVATSIGTPVVRWRRGELSQASALVFGDILLYQARGGAIRGYIHQCVEAIDDEVVLLAHSLGGVACVDLLINRALPKVTRLITIGSQAPMFHELGALWSLEPGTPDLPGHFPRWLNVYDPYDFLSYVAAGVFPSGKVQDHRVDSYQPFPQSHGAYWTDSSMWTTIRSFIA